MIYRLERNEIDETENERIKKKIWKK